MSTTTTENNNTKKREAMSPPETSKKRVKHETLPEQVPEKQLAVKTLKQQDQEPEPDQEQIQNQDETSNNFIKSNEKLLLFMKNIQDGKVEYDSLMDTSSQHHTYLKRLIEEQYISPVINIKGIYDRVKANCHMDEIIQAFNDLKQIIKDSPVIADIYENAFNNHKKVINKKSYQ